MADDFLPDICDGNYSWLPTAEVAVEKARSCVNELSGSASGSCITIQDSGLPIPLSPSTMDWTQAMLRGSNRAETTFHAMLQDDLNSRPFFSTHEPSIDSDRSDFLRDPHHRSSGHCGFGNPSLAPSLYGVDFATKIQTIDGGSGNHRLTITNQLHLSNTTPFWNSSSWAATIAKSGFNPSMTSSDFTMKTFEQKINGSQPRSEGSRCSSSQRSISKESEPSTKKLRLETPSLLPTFKVRKEKLGDRITALQQLVSPFGKTDTASVLNEVVEYIKLLHDQLNVLCTPYSVNEHSMQQHKQNKAEAKEGEGLKQGLRGRGLCLVPVSTMYQVTCETAADFWTPNFGGTYR